MIEHEVATLSGGEACLEAVRAEARRSAASYGAGESESSQRTTWAASAIR